MPGEFFQINLHGNDVKSLYKFFEPDILPEELGGTLGPAEKLKQVNEENVAKYFVNGLKSSTWQTDTEKNPPKNNYYTVMAFSNPSFPK